jgi:hypothetical protein
VTVATCPRCGGFLDANHRCQGLWRRRARSVTASLLAMAVGASAGILLLYAIASRPSTPTIAVAALTGMVIGEAIRGAAAG